MKLLVYLMLFSMAYSFSYAIEDLPAKIVSSNPPQLKISKQKEFLEIVLYGYNLIPANASDQLWQARNMHIWIRSASHPAWHLLYDNLRGPGYQELDHHKGTVGFKTKTNIVLHIPRNIFFSKEGFFEIRIDKGKWNPDKKTHDITVMNSSNIFRIPIMEYPKYIVNIMLSPQFYSLDEKNKNIFLRGKFMWGSTIKVNGQIIKPHYFNATHGLIEFKNNFTKEGKNSVVLIDPQRIMSNEQFFWKISKPLITAIHPTSFKIIDSSKILQFSNLNVEWVGPKVKKVIIQLEREKVPTEKTTINNGSIVKSKPIIILPIQNADSATKMKVFEIPSTKFSQTGNQVQVYVPNSFLTHPGKLIITFYSDLSAIEQQIAVIHAPGNKLFQKRKNFQRPTLTKPGGLNKPSGGKK